MISAIAAMSLNRVIGINNTLPWHLPADLAHFKQLTSFHTIIMGRKTFQSIGKPLPNRRNIIISNNLTFTAEGCEVVHSLEAALMLTKTENEIFIIGGGTIYEIALPYLDKIYLTVVEKEFAGDAFFPTLTPNFQLTHCETHSADEKNLFPYRFEIWQKT